MARRGCLRAHRALRGTLTALLTLCLLCAGASTLKAGDAQPHGGASEPLVQCAVLESQDGRLVRERWATQQSCEEPGLTRVIDRLLGFTCTRRKDSDAVCRAFMPTIGRRLAVPSKFVPCVGVEMTIERGELIFDRVIEWIGNSMPCDFTPPEGTAAIDVNLMSGEICVLPDRLCTAADRLTIIGRSRLRERLVSAINRFRSVDASAPFDQTVGLPPRRNVLGLAVLP